MAEWLSPDFQLPEDRWTIILETLNKRKSKSFRHPDRQEEFKARIEWIMGHVIDLKRVKIDVSDSFRRLSRVQAHFVGLHDELRNLDKAVASTVRIKGTDLPKELRELQALVEDIERVQQNVQALALRLRGVATIVDVELANLQLGKGEKYDPPPGNDVRLFAKLLAAAVEEIFEVTPNPWTDSPFFEIVNDVLAQVGMTGIGEHALEALLNFPGK